MWSVKEGAPSFDDFSEVKTVLVSDEAHHLNVDTRKGKKSADDDSSKSWEYTVRDLILCEDGGKGCTFRITLPTI